MNDIDVRDLLARVADEVPPTPVDPEPLLHRGYRRMAKTAIVGALGLACAVALVVGGVGLIRSSAPTTTPADRGGQPTGPPSAVGETTGTYNGPCMDSQDGPPQQVCLGPLDEGTYTSQRFEPALTFTVPAPEMVAGMDAIGPQGWNNPWDTRGEFGLWAPGWMEYGDGHPTDCRGAPSPCGYIIDHPGLSVRRDPRPDEGCSGYADATVGTSALEVAAWVANHPAIATKAPSPVEVAGLTGYQLDVSLADTWQKSCPESPAVWLFADVYLRVSGGEYPGVLNQGSGDATMRLILLDLPDGGTVLIAIDGDSVDAAMPVVGSFEFDLN